MGKKFNIYLVISVFTVVLLLVLQYNKPKDLNWYPSYVSHHKIPFGTYVLNELMQNKFESAEAIQTPPFEFLDSNFDAEGTYFFVNNDISFGKGELNKLLDWTASGNTLFIASTSFEEKLLDTLHLTTSGLFADFGDGHEYYRKLVNPNLKPDSIYLFKKSSYSNFFKSIDTVNTTALGLVDTNKDSLIRTPKRFDFIRQDFGDGEIILSAFPKAFTNYFILKDDNRNYTAGLLSYIDDSKPVFMDNYYKAGKTFYTSPMYIFLNTKEFKWAYYLVLIGALFYVIFEGKRKQRAIPVVVPLKNQTLAFTHTIANMYFEKGQQKAISEHKINQFLEFIRTHFYMETNERNEEFYQNLAARSSHSNEEIKNIFDFIRKLKKQTVVTDTDLTKLNRSIEKFKHKSNGK